MTEPGIHETKEEKEERKMVEKTLDDFKDLVKKFVDLFPEASHDELFEIIMNSSCERKDREIVIKMKNGFENSEIFNNTFKFCYFISKIEGSSSSKKMDLG